MRRKYRGLTASSLALPLMALIGSCGQTVESIGERAFVEAVNLKCRSDKAKFAVAKRIAGELADTPKGQELQSDAQKRLDDLGANWKSLQKYVAKLKGPKPVQDALERASAELQKLPGAVADKTVTPQEAKAKLEAARDDLRARGFVDCV
jgi:hypothetical protein